MGDMWVCSQKHNYVCINRCYILLTKKLHVSAGNGHQVFLKQIKVVLY